MHGRRLIEPSRKAIGSLIELCHRLRKDQSGAAMMLIGAVTPILIGVSALGMDASYWYMEKRILQNDSDLGALGGAHRAAGSSSASEIKASVHEALADNHHTSKTGDNIVINSPPASGPNSGKSGFVEVVMERDAQFFLAGLFMDDNARIRVRSVAGSVPAGEHCVLSLDDTTGKALEFTGSANVTLGCGVAANSNSEESIYISGSANLTADPAQSFGDIYVGGSATLTTNHPVQTYAQKVKDPYGPEGRDLTMPDIGTMGCDYTNLKINSGTAVIPSGTVICDGLSIGSSAHVTLEPGPHYFYGGEIKVNGGATIVGDGVSLLLSGPDPTDVTELNFLGNAQLDLEAPSGDPASNPLAGVLIFQDPMAQSFSGSSFVTNSFLGTASSDILGAVYMPSQEIRFQGGSSSSNACIQLIGRKVTFSGDGSLKQVEASCDALGVEKIAQVRVKLVE